MTQINLIRDLAKSGYKISEIHEMTKSDPKTINKYLEKDDFSPVPPIGQQRPSKVDPFRDKIAEYLEEDKKHWNKQHHTAMRIYERLKKEEGLKRTNNGLVLGIRAAYVYDSDSVKTLSQHRYFFTNHWLLGWNIFLAKFHFPFIIHDYLLTLQRQLHNICLKPNSGL